MSAVDIQINQSVLRVSNSKVSPLIILSLFTFLLLVGSAEGRFVISATTRRDVGLKQDFKGLFTSFQVACSIHNVNL